MIGKEEHQHVQWGGGKAALFGSFFNIQQVLLQYLGFCCGHLEGSVSAVIKAPPLSQVPPLLQQIVPSSVVQDGAAAPLQRAGLKRNLSIKAATGYGSHPAHPGGGSFTGVEGRSFTGVGGGAWHRCTSSTVSSAHLFITLICRTSEGSQTSSLGRIRSVTQG